MKPWIRLVGFIALVALVAGVACYTGGRMALRHASVDQIEHHYWIHRHLKLRKDQEKALEAIEHKFEEQRKQLTEAIWQGNKDLAEAIRADKADSRRVGEAVNKIHRAQGELQRAVLEHVFDMKSVLTPEQYDQLIRLTADTLSATPDSN